MSQAMRNDMIERLCSRTSMNENEVVCLSDAEVEYYHWLYFEDESVYNLM
ncbi:BH0509 family protein [Sediminibacillus massiliensis]|nr:BH0509 family protein [Sediminibacillus massiliensis]